MAASFVLMLSLGIHTPTCIQGNRLVVNAAPVRAHRVGLQVVARAAGADADKKVPKKKMPSPVKRALITEERRMYNKQRKSACATRVKKARHY